MISIGIGAFVFLGVVVVIAAVLRTLWVFVRVSNHDPLTPMPPNERSAWARRWAGVYVRRPESGVAETRPEGAETGGSQTRPEGSGETRPEGGRRNRETGGSPTWPGSGTAEAIERVVRSHEPVIPG